MSRKRSQYELIDFGFGRKLERFGDVKVLRDCPAADDYHTFGELIKARNGVVSYSRSRKSWSNLTGVPDPWIIQVQGVTFELKPTPYGHLGIFPEQTVNWQWINQLETDLQGKRVLNLFAYTGGTTLAFAKRGAQVTHVDSAKNVVRWASQNAKASGLGGAKIRWIVEDAKRFVGREIKRGNFYDIVVADPPAIGHAGQKLTWQIENDIESLMDGLNQLTNGNVMAILLSCHSAGFDFHRLKQLAQNAFGDLCNGQTECGTMDLISKDHRKLNCGHYFRWNATT